MRLLREKIFFETTEEMRETKKNLKEAKDKVVSKVKDTIKHPGKIVDGIKKTGKNTIRIARKPKLAGKLIGITGRKAIKYIKENPRDAVYLAAGDSLPLLVGKVVSEKEGEEAGVAAAGTTAALPIGEVAVGIDHLSRSEKGKTAMKATGQVIKGVASDLGNIIIRRKRK